MQEAIEQFIKHAHCIGKHKEYVQGAGGNISIKYQQRYMIIKSSGYNLTDVNYDRGYSIVDYKNIIYSLEKETSQQNNTYSSLNTSDRPSMETSIHVLLDKAVIHTHSIYANIINCSQEGEQIMRDIFPDALWIQYANPGYDLFCAIKEKLFQEQLPNIIFLQNHGVIISHNNIEQAFHIHDLLNKKIQDHFLLAHNTLTLKHKQIHYDELQENVLFPDQAVYSQSKHTNKQTLSEIYNAYFYIFNTIKALSLTPYFIKQEDIKLLITMEAEQYRQAQGYKKSSTQ